jgi:single-stranded-DNA-specific exonuclease
MSYFPKQWVLKKPNLNLIGEIADKLNILRTTSSVLVNKGVGSVREADIFLNPNFFDLKNPFLLSDMNTAVKRIRRAIDSNEKILIYGDRDVDGVTAVCVLYYTLKSLGTTPLWYIPSEQGYGLHKSIIEQYIGKIDLIITVDCGITAYDEVLYARENGIDVIITDHHELPSHQKELPRAVAVINPKRKDNKYSFNKPAGCFVALKFAQGLMMSYEEYYDKDMIVLDIKTTGPHPIFDETSEIAAVKIKNFVAVESFHTLAKPETNELSEFIGDMTIIAHNAEFTMNFIRNYMKKSLNRKLNNPVIDTLTLSREFFPFKSYAIGSLLQDLGFEQPGNAGTDCAPDGVLTTLKVYERLEQMGNTRIRFFLQDHLDLLTIGTIGDMMPLVEENRIIVKHGLKTLRETRKTGIKLLVERFIKGNGSVTAKMVSYNIVPLLNACGRLGKAELAVELLTADNIYRAEKILEQVIELNEERRLLQSTNIDKFNQLIREQCDIERDKIIFVTASGVGHGVTGIVASQLVRRYNRPVILLIIEGDEAVGAGRSIEGFNIYDVVKRCDDILIKYGGHSNAIGLTVKVSDIKELHRRFKDIVSQELSPELLIRKIEIDAELKPSELNMELINELARLEPYGQHNSYPIFMLKSLKIEKCSRVGSTGEHLKLKIRNTGDNYFDVIGWGLGDACDTVLKELSFVDLAGQVGVNRWHNKDSMQITVMDLRPSL